MSMSINPASTGEVQPQPAGQPVTITAAAVDRLRKYAGENPEFQGKAFRVFIEGGGCSGMRYGFVFDDAGEEDFRWDVDGQPVAIDPVSMNYLRGAKVDYVSDLRGEGFVVDNPNAKTSCGCGHSFGS
jgi:iron-sulfur cluster insertion protein